MALPTRTNPQVPPKYGPVIPATPVQTPGQTSVPKKRQIIDLISHIAKADNHLWQALNSLQDQTNSIVGSSTQWTSWNPKIQDDTTPQPLPVPTVGLSAYYMSTGTILYIEIYSRALTINSNPNPQFITVSLPVDIGDTIIRTCSAYLTPVTSPTANGVIGVELRKRTATITINPAFRTLICKFAMGGAIGIIQGTGEIETTAGN